MAKRKDCPACGCPMLPKGQKREHPDDYRHARGCPKAGKREHEATEKLWRDLARRSAERKEKGGRSHDGS